MVDNTDKLEEAGTPYVRRITLVPLVCPGVRAGPQKKARPPLRHCHSRCVLGAGRRTPPQEWDTTGAAWEGPSYYKLINKGLEYSN